MTDIYGRMNLIMESMSTVCRILKKNRLHASSSDIEFDMAIKRIKKFLNLDTNEAAIFSLVFYTYFYFVEKPICFSHVSDELDTNILRILAFRDVFDSLEQKGIITVEKINDRENSNSKFYRIPENVVNAVLANDEKLLYIKSKKKNRNLIYPEDIATKEIFYMDNIKNEVESLTEYLEKENLEKIQNRLAEKSLPKGVCIMLYGESGTGKTETVFQVARKTGRALYHVDIGGMKSQWVGETEKNLSALFERYSLMCKQAKEENEEIPILLFNEADALFGKRVDSPRNAEISQNQIQSLLLDWIEKQEGILIITTNIPGNFDEAFERRFLFKLKFTKPNLEVKKKIWENKVSWLNKQSIEKLASQYALSGAEIDNIVRKATMKEVLTGKSTSFEELEAYCKDEKLESNEGGAIGFVK